MAANTLKIIEMGNRLSGRFHGRQHFAKACELLAGVEPNTVVTLDFSGTEYVSASWINAMIIPLILFATDEKNDFYVVVANFPEASGDDLHLVAEHNRVPVIVVSNNTAAVGTIYGTLDPVQRETLAAVQRKGEATGVALASEPNQTASGAAWNNRLRDLNLKRLLRRRRAGREQIYSAVIPEVRFNG